MDTEVTFFDRPELALARLAEGDVGASARALLAPKTLTPHERRRMLEAYLPEESRDSPFGKALAVATNPLVLLGAILTLRFPVASARNIMKVSAKVGGYGRWLNPLAKFFGSMDESFRGTKVPELFRGLARAVMGVREKYLGAVADTGLASILREYRAMAGRRLDPETAFRVVLKLDGLDKPGSVLARQLGLPSIVNPKYAAGGVPLSKEGRWFYEKMRGVGKTKGWFEEIFEEVLEPGTRVLRENLARRAYSPSAAQLHALEERVSIQGARSLLKEMRKQGIAVSGLDDLKKYKDYWPHIASVLPEQSAYLAEVEKIFPKQRAAIATGGIKRATTLHAADRYDMMLPDPNHLRRVGGDVLHPRLVERVEQELVRRRGLWEQNLLGSYPHVYSLELVPVAERYTNSLARAYGLTVHPERYGVKIAGELGKAIEAGEHGLVRAEMLQNTYIPWALGMQTYKQGIRGLGWTSLKKWAVDSLDGPVLGKAVPQEWRDRMKSMILDSAAVRTPTAAAGGLAGWFYLTTLGVNPASATLNMMQTLLTTTPAIGIEATGEGMLSVFRKTGQYMRARSGGLTAERAFAKAYPEFFKAGLTPSPVLEDVVHGGMERAWLGVSGFPTAGQRVKAAMMSLFSTSEKFVRLTAFEGMRLKAVKEGLGAAESIGLARELVERTQFLPGFTGTPYGFINLSPALRQFATFPVKMTEFLLGPGTTWGSSEMAGLGGRNLGTLGRAMLASGTAYGAGKEFLDVDLSRGLLWQALPQPTEDQPFAPLPIVPPVLSIGGAVASDLVSGEWEQIPKQLPLLVPGGVSLSRAVGMGRVAGFEGAGVSKALGREYADYERTTPDGRVPVYSPGGSLKGYFTPGQLMVRAAGLTGFGRFRDESAMMAYLVRQRDQILQYRNRYVQAYLENDVQAMSRINGEFKRRYPEIGDLPLKPLQLRQAKNMRDVSRIERMIESMPKEARPLFSNVVGTALSAQAQGMLGIEPSLLGWGTINQRAPYRAGAPGGPEGQAHRPFLPPGT